MEVRLILTEQRDVVKSWRGDFHAQSCDEGIRYVYKGCMLGQSYCEFLGIDCHTISLLGSVGYAIEYNCIEGNRYVLKCETYINSLINEKLSFELVDDEDYLGFYRETKETEDKAQGLPSNWKELITDDMLEELLDDDRKESIAKDWCNEHSDELKHYLSDSDKEEIAYEYIDDDAYTLDCVDRAYDNLGDYDKREFIKNCIDNL